MTPAERVPCEFRQLLDTWLGARRLLVRQLEARDAEIRGLTAKVAYRDDVIVDLRRELRAIRKERGE